jgi:probable addiction module antidote protein
LTLLKTVSVELEFWFEWIGWCTAIPGSIGFSVDAEKGHSNRYRTREGTAGVVMTKSVSKAKSSVGARTKTVPYDVSAHLRTAEEMAAYLDAWLEEAPDDAAGISRALGDIARAKGMSQVARDAGLSRESLYKALGEKGNPSFATVLKVVRALGVKFHAEPA